MGLLVKAKCDACHYEVFLHVSSEAATHVDTPYEWPHACLRCRSVVSADLGRANNRCPNCGHSAVVAYEADRLNSAAKRGLQLQDAHVSLRKNRQYCPCCGRPQLRFMDIAVHA